MAYLLKNLPLEKDLQALAERHLNLSPPYLEAIVRLLNAGAELNQSIERFFESRGLSNARFSILFLLHRQKPTLVRQSEVVQKLSLSRASVTSFLASLERDGMIKRYPCKEDGRAYRLQLTRKGVKTVEDLIPRHFKHLGELISCLSRQEAQQLRAILDKVLDAALRSTTK